MKVDPVLYETNFSKDIIQHLQAGLNYSGHYPGLIGNFIEKVIATAKSGSFLLGLATDDIAIRLNESPGITPPA